MKFDFIVYPESRISNIRFGILRFLALLIRNFIPRKKRFLHEFDGMASNHIFSFLSQPNFLHALNKAVNAGGRNYNINLRLHQAIWCANLAHSSLGGCSFVEIGTGRGYIMSAVLGDLEKLLPPAHSDHEFYLFDSFEPFQTDLVRRQDSSLGKSPYYAESFEKVVLNFASYPNVKLVKGELPQSLDDFGLQNIGFLHIDLNAPEIEIQCLEKLWNQLLPGAVILIDDYAYQGYQYTNELFNQIAKKLGFRILTTASGQGIIIKSQQKR